MKQAPKKDDEAKKRDKKREDQALDEELEDTFPASDPPSMTSPEHGSTGAEPKGKKA